MNAQQEISLLNIKAVGSWNPKIIQPEWLIRLISPEKKNEEKVEVLFNIVARDLGYVIRNVTIFPRSHELEMSINKNDINKETQEFAVDTFTKILKTLSHTPITGIGFNINYEFKYDENNKLSSWIKNNRNNYLNSEIEQYRFTIKKNDYKLNIIVELLDKIKANFNFHYGNKKRDFPLDHFSKLIIETEEYL